MDDDKDVMIGAGHGGDGHGSHGHPHPSSSSSSSITTITSDGGPPKQEDGKLFLGCKKEGCNGILLVGTTTRHGAPYQCPRCLNKQKYCQDCQQLYINFRRHRTLGHELYEFQRKRQVRGGGGREGGREGMWLICFGAGALREKVRAGVCVSLLRLFSCIFRISCLGWDGGKRRLGQALLLRGEGQGVGEPGPRPL